MDKLAFVDAGELGWSLYISAHIRWLKKDSDPTVIVIGYPDRRCLYEGIADAFMDMPEIFYKKYNLQYQDSFKLRYVGWDELRLFFLPRIPSGFRIPDYTEYPSRFMRNRRIHEPYRYSKAPENGKEVLIFPRFRNGLSRNLPINFYLQLIKRLCDEFPKMTVRTIGTKTGAYNIRAKKPNYINWVDKGGSIQDMINKCQSAIAAIGSHSAPTKISLLQGVPTFMIGHEAERHTQEENWIGTKAGFYKIPKKGYSDINSGECIKAATAFVKGVQ